MSGAATVIGILSAVAENKIKHNVVGVIAACENAIGPNAYRPGDVIGSLNGKTIEVTNTDAEGRLTLADALTYSIRIEKATELIDIATLTGARSEEHTSELQSRQYLVCRLLLEKKKKN